jgi:hypothetical protein
VCAIVNSRTGRVPLTYKDQVSKVVKNGHKHRNSRTAEDSVGGR